MMEIIKPIKERANKINDGFRSLQIRVDFESPAVPPDETKSFIDEITAVFRYEHIPDPQRTGRE